MKSKTDRELIEELRLRTIKRTCIAYKLFKDTRGKPEGSEIYKKSITEMYEILGDIHTVMSFVYDYQHIHNFFTCMDDSKDYLEYILDLENKSIRVKGELDMLINTEVSR